MKFINISLFACLLLLLSGCIKEDRDNCENKLILDFEHKDKSGNDILLKAVNKVDVFIFDDSNKLVYKRKIDKETLTETREASIKLIPGKYHIVSWANANDYSTFENAEIGLDRADLRLKNPTLTNKHIVNGDPLYYYATDVDLTSPAVDLGGIIRKKIPFCKAHIKIELYVKGLEDNSGTTTNLPPLIELTNLSSDYDFDMVTTEDNISAINKTVYKTIDGNEFAVVDFHPTVFSKDTASELFIRKQSDNSVVTAISLKDFIEKNKIDLTGCTQTIIPIYVEYKSTEVSITIPSWEQVPVKPDF